MKRNRIKPFLIITLTNLLISSSIIAQSPQKMSYQAVIRNSSDQLVTNHAVGMRVSILQGSETGTPVYVETQTTASNLNGLVTIEIGGGTPVTGTFAGIDWSTGTYFIKTETDPAGGTSYSITGTSQILSVPYALYSNSVKLTYNNRPADLYVLDDGSLWSVPEISVEKPCATTPSVSDNDGNTYGTVKIGTQIWMAENLKTTKLNDGTPIPNVTDGTEWQNSITPAYCWYNNDNANKPVYGALYNWYTVNTGKLCPADWHVPSDAEWYVLFGYLGGLDAGRMKEAGTAHWLSPNFGATNDSKFSALPAGQRAYTDFYGIHEGAHFWTTDAFDLGSAYCHSLYYKASKVDSDGHDMSIFENNRGNSVRCIKN
jgi:uncharacterized protein (TIGR02145 family)